MSSALRRLMGLPSISVSEILSSSEPDSISDIKIGVINASNGKVLEIAKYKPSNRGPDWTKEYYIVQAGQTLAEAIQQYLLANGLEH
jgi:hypothetical protein